MHCDEFDRIELEGQVGDNLVIDSELRAFKELSRHMWLWDHEALNHSISSAMDHAW